MKYFQGFHDVVTVFFSTCGLEFGYLLAENSAKLYFRYKKK